MINMYDMDWYGSNWGCQDLSMWATFECASSRFQCFSGSARWHTSKRQPGRLNLKEWPRHDHMSAGWGRWGHDWGARVQPVATIGGWKSLWNSNMRHPGAIWSSEFNVRCRSESSSKPLSIFKLDLFGETTVVSMAGAPKHAKTSNTHLQRCLQGTAQTWDLKPPKQIGQGQISTLVTGDFTLQV